MWRSTAGLKDSKVAHFGWLFSRNRRGMYFPHSHSIVYSTKDIHTGRKVTRITKEVLARLQAYWKDVVHWEAWPRWQKMPTRHTKSSRPFDSTHLWNPEGIASYITGPRNMGFSGQRWERLPSHNLELLERKVLQAQLRRAA